MVLKSGLLRQSKARAHADANHHDIGFDHRAALQRRAFAVDRGHGVAEVEDNAMLFMQGTDEVGLADGSKKVLHPGETSATPGSTTHYHRNVGKDNVVLIAVDVFKPAK